MKKFESEIKKAQDDLTIILSINFDEEKAKAMHGSVELACISSCFCLLLAGLAVMSYFSPAAIGVLMAVIVSVVPFLATAFFGIVAGCFTAGTLAPVVWAFFGSACFTLALLTFSGVCIAAPFFGHAFVALSAICLVFAIASSINAFVLKCKNTEDFIKQNIQSKIEDHITLFQKNSASQMESNENLNVDLERSLNPC